MAEENKDSLDVHHPTKKGDGAGLIQKPYMTKPLTRQELREKI